jgi:hypothetical protein
MAGDAEQCRQSLREARGGILIVTAGVAVNVKMKAIGHWHTLAGGVGMKCAVLGGAGPKHVNKNGVVTVGDGSSDAQTDLRCQRRKTWIYSIVYVCGRNGGRDGLAGVCNP